MLYSVDTERTIHSIEEIVVEINLAKTLGCQPGERWLLLQTSRKTLEPVASLVSWAYVYIRKDDGEKIRPFLESCTKLISDLICEKTGHSVKEIRQELRATGIPASLAEKLGTKPDAPAMEVTRQYFDEAGQVFEVVISLHPANRFTYKTILHRVT